jgi:hypothetical protein
VTITSPLVIELLSLIDAGVARLAIRLRPRSKQLHRWQRNGILGFNSVDFSVFALSDVMRLRAAIDSPLGLLGLDSMRFAACDAMRM